ncbi:hypothetical protein [Sulfurimonas sp.]|jgi:hypothetical protein|uniref:hypothetical protein n=1 Tax=Sulfurimonas sp. TaxID=2022749 RepID=UPI0025D69D84|nr:hypothetical protein [Sulfurimonas sp.]MCK9473209.1 hypothetical protein [Sulfurimonas sp.]MDD3506658.1 hypothetical protein [Sulfurimonas sp.]
MKPLLKKDIESFLKRFDNFVDAEFRSIEILCATTLKITLATQDRARGFNWITITLEFNDVTDALLLENSKLSHVDMSEGITLLYENNQFAFGISSYSNLDNITDSICYIKADSLKYLEGAF